MTRSYSPPSSFRHLPRYTRPAPRHSTIRIPGHVVQPGEVTLVPTGLVIEAPPNTFLGVFARSSTPLKRG
jgi:dUTPase